MKGRVAIVGGGPGGAELLTVRGAALAGAVAADLTEAIARAKAGEQVALVVPGDAAGADDLVAACVKARVAWTVVPGVAADVYERACWAARLPLHGRRVLVPRADHQAGALSAELRALGAEPVEVPTIAVEPPRNPAALDKAIVGIETGRYAWIGFTSANGVAALRDRLEVRGLDARILAGVKLGCVGDATAAALAAWGLRPELVPPGTATAESLARAWPPRDPGFDPLDRVLLPRADLARSELPEKLKAKGWAVDDVTAYRTVRAAPPAPDVRAAVRDGGFAAAVFTSPSTVRNLVGLCGTPAGSTIVAVIGPRTAEAAAELGLRVDVVSRDQSAAGLAAALAAYLRRGSR